MLGIVEGTTTIGQKRDIQAAHEQGSKNSLQSLVNFLISCTSIGIPLAQFAVSFIAILFAGANLGLF